MRFALSCCAFAILGSPLASFSVLGQAVPLTREVVSREFSIFAGAEQVPLLKDAFSREVSFFIEANSGDPYEQAVSRETSLVVTTLAPPERVSGIIVTVSPTGDAANLDWSHYNELAQHDLLQYRVYVSSGPLTTISNQAPYKIVPAGQFSLSVTNLPPWQDHYFAVVAEDALHGVDTNVNSAAAYVLAPQAISREVSLFAGASSSAPYPQAISRETSLLITTPEAPQHITQLTVRASPTGESATLDWSGYSELSQRDIVRYDVYVSTRPFTSISNLTRATNVLAGTSSLTISNLTPYQDHYFAVVPVDGAGQSDPAVDYSAAYVVAAHAVSREFSMFAGGSSSAAYSQVVSREMDVLVPDAAVPEPVTGVSSGFRASTSLSAFSAIDLDWSTYNELAQHDVVRYAVYLGPSFFTDVSPMQPYEYVPAGNFRHTVKGLHGDGIYYVAVVAEDALKQRNSTVRSVSAQASIGTLGEVGNLVVAAFTNSLHFSWTAPTKVDAFLSAFRIYFGTSSNALILPASAISYEASGLQPSTGYNFRIATVDIFGTESAGLSLLTATLLNQPRNLAAEPLDKRVRLTWSHAEPNNLVKNYAVYAAPTNFASVAKLSPVLTTRDARADVTGLINGSRYFFAVTTVNLVDSQALDVQTVSATPSPVVGTFADFAITNVAAPSAAYQGQAFSVNWLVTNIGQGGASTKGGQPVSSWSDRIILSRDDVVGDADDRILTNVTHAGAVAPGASYTGSAAVQAPTNLLGNYFLFVMANAGGQVYEALDLGTNLGASPLAIGLATAPVITQQPASRAVDSGSPVTFTVTAIGSEPLAYQWQRDGGNLLNATNSSYSIANGQPSDNGVYAVRVSNAAGSVISSNALLTVTPADTVGPALSAPRYGAAPLVNGMVLTRPDTLVIDAADPSGVGRVEFYLDSVLLNTDSNGSDGFSAVFNADSYPDGPHAIIFKAWDVRNNSSALTNVVTITLSPPPAPVIGTPSNGAVVSDQLVVLRGTALKNASVVLYRNGSRVGTPSPVTLTGTWETIIPLVAGTNRLQAAAQNRAGEGPRSTEVAVNLDLSIPQPPNGLQAIAKEAGQIQLQWLPSPEAAAYHVYRGTKAFTDIAQASRLTSAARTNLVFLDLPPADAKYFYRVTALNQANTEGPLSTVAFASSDRLPPSALTVSYHPETNFDVATGRIGRTLVNVVLQMSEPLQNPPFFSLTPNGGLPIIVDLHAAQSNQFLGAFAITENTPSGQANAVLSARDVAGNRGTDILTGDSILIDANGPEVTDLSVTPSGLIRNNSNAPVLVTFTAHLSEPVRSNTTPKFSYTLSSTSTAARPMSSVRQGSNSVTWIVTLNLPPTAGVPAETLTLLFQAEDDIGNVGSRIVPPHALQVYQGNLPLLESPAGLRAKSVPAGGIQLEWGTVPEAAGYQLYRRGPGDANLVPTRRAAKVTTFVDTPPTDGSYSYAVASLRQANGQESLSPFGNIVTAKSDRVPPAQPANLSVELASNGAFIQWVAAQGLAEPVTYNLYRTNRGPIAAVVGIVPLISKIPSSQVVDPKPTAVEPYYAVAAVDDAGNVSPPSNTGYQNVELLPIGTFTIGLTNASPPVLSWTQSGNTIAGHKLYLGEDTARVQLGGLIPNSISTYTDTGYAGDDRRYTVATVDQNQQQSIGRSLRLPRLTASLETNAIVKRGLMNHLVYVVTNASPGPVANAQIKVVFGGRSHASASFDLAGSSSTNISVTVGGYADLPDGSASVSTIMEIRPHDGELVSISRSGQVPIGDGQLILSVMGSRILRGSAGSVQFSLFNPSPEEIELITATGNAANPSPDIRFTLLDGDGHVLASAPFRSSVGNGIVNLPNGNSVLRLAPGAEIVSTSTALPIPATTPDRVFVNVEIDKIYYHSDREDRVEMTGVQTRREFAVVETSYTGAVTAVTPASSQGVRPILISGSAQFRANGQPAPNVPLLVKIASGGFERTEQVLTDSSGNFTTAFTPLAAEPGGVYSVWAVHPDLSDRTVQQTFVIQRVLAAPSQFTVRAPYGFAQPVQLGVSTGQGTTVTNLHLEYRPADQANGTLRPGVDVSLAHALPVLGPNQSGVFNLTFTGATGVAPRGSLVLVLTSDGAGADGWQKINVSYEFSEAKPSVRWSPSFVDTGVAPGSAVSETATFDNVGLVSATGVRFSLVQTNGAAAPAWASINSRTNIEELRVGDTIPLALRFQPTNNTPEGDYLFVLQMRAQNTAPIDLGVHVAVLSTNLGGVLFKVLDMYSGLTRTNPATGSIYVTEGVAGAKIQLQNETVESFTTNAVTDAKGELLLENLPGGQYKFHVTADTHNSFNGRLWVRPGSIANQQVALSYSLVSVEWEVVPITIQDRYEIVLQATFETDVPAPVVTIEPAMVNLPQLFAGDVYYGEFSLFNHGLIRADHLKFQMPSSDEYVQYEQLQGVPDHLDARQRLRVPYRVICRRSFPGPAQANSETSPQLIRAKQAARPKTADTAGTCYTYRAAVGATFDFMCENGLNFSGGAGSGYYYNYSSGNCGGGGGVGGGGPTFGGGGGSGGGPIFSQGGTSIPVGPACFPAGDCPQPDSSCDTKSCDCQQPAGSWVSLLSREYQDEVEDLSIKVPGGQIKVVRQLYKNGWHWTHVAHRLKFNQGSSGLTSIEYNTATYSAMNSAGTAFQFHGNRIRQEGAGWRWRNKDGEWELFDSVGRLQSSGTRNLTVAIYIYDSGGNLIGVNDRNNRRILTYDSASGFITSVRDLTGRRVLYTWQGGQLAKVTDALNQEFTYTYDNASRLTRKTDVNGHTLNIAYDSAGYVSSVLDTNNVGLFFQFIYDKNLRQYYAQVKTTGGRIKEVRFDADGNLLSRTQNGIAEKQVLRDGRNEIHTAATGVTTRREFDEFGNLTKQINPDGGVTTWEYELLYHQPIRIVDPRGAITLLAYDANGNLTNKIEAAEAPIARTNSWAYNADNLLARHIDGRGNKMDYKYDLSGNLIREFDPDNPAYQTTYGYDARGNRTAMTNALGYATLYGYDDQNRLIAETNALNYVTLYTYAGKNLVQVETGRDRANRGRIVRYRYDNHDRRTQTIRVDDKDQEHIWETTTYDGDGNMIASANALNQTTRYEYNTSGQRTKIIRPFSATETSDTQFVYDNFERLSREIDPLNVVTLHEYDEMDRERKVTEALGTPVERSRARGYDLSGNLTSITYSDGTNDFTTLYSYDLLSRRIQIRGAREYPKDFQYDASNNLMAEINGRGYATLYAYDQYNRRTNTVEGNGNGEPGEHAASIEYDQVGQVLTSFDGNWNHRHYHYDALGRQTEESLPLGPTKALPAASWWTDISVVLNRSQLNPWGQPVATSNIVGAVNATAYDALARRSTHTDASGLTLTNEYNALDQLVALHYPVVSSAPPGSPPTSLRNDYDPHNAQMLVAATDRANLTMRYGYEKRLQRASELSPWSTLTTYRIDELGRQVVVTNALHEVTQSVFDQFDQLVATIYADHVPLTHERIEYRAYDEFGRITNHWGAATYNVIYGYDLAGNQDSLTDGNGNTTRWEYDGRNRKVRKILADNTTYEYGYDANGNQVRRRDASQRTTKYAFNAYNLMIYIDYPNDPDVSFDYDAAGRRIMMVDGTGTNSWTYDVFGHALSNVQSNVRHVVSYTYDREGNRLSMTVSPLPDGEARITDYKYDQAARLVSIMDDSSADLPYRYTWAKDANRLNGIDFPSGMKTQYAYDLLNRKTSLSTFNPAQVQICQFAYSYDQGAQRTSETTLTYTDVFTYDLKRQLTSARRILVNNVPDPTWNFSYSYDPVGNYTTTDGPVGFKDFRVNSVNQYSNIGQETRGSTDYDAEGNLIQSDNNRFWYSDSDRLSAASNSTARVTFEYDGIGRRVAVRNSGDWGSNRVVIVYDDFMSVGILQDNGLRGKWITRGLDLSLSRDGLAGIGGLLAVSGADETAYSLADARGNVRAAVGAKSGRISLETYLPFGYPTDLADTLSPFGFSTKEWFPEFGLVDFGLRVYSPTTGRWISRDPAEEDGGINLYNFVQNNPINMLDAVGAKGEPSSGCQTQNQPFAGSFFQGMCEYSGQLRAECSGACCKAISGGVASPFSACRKPMIKIPKLPISLTEEWRVEFKDTSVFDSCSRDGGKSQCGTTPGGLGIIGVEVLLWKRECVQGPFGIGKRCWGDVVIGRKPFNLIHTCCGR